MHNMTTIREARPGAVHGQLVGNVEVASMEAVDRVYVAGVGVFRRASDSDLVGQPDRYRFSYYPESGSRGHLKLTVTLMPEQ
jgi:hypothetical protein